MKAEQQQEQFGDVLGKVFVLAILASIIDYWLLLSPDLEEVTGNLMLFFVSSFCVVSQSFSHATPTMFQSCEEIFLTLVMRKR